MRNYKITHKWKIDGYKFYEIVAANTPEEAKKWWEWCEESSIVLDVEETTEEPSYIAQPIPVCDICFENYINVQQELDEIINKITIKMLSEGMPTEMKSEADRLEKIIWEFEHQFPFAVQMKGTETYKMIGGYTTAEEAIENCPEYDACVINTTTNRVVYYSPDHPLGKRVKHLVNR